MIIIGNRMTKNSMMFSSRRNVGFGDDESVESIDTITQTNHLLGCCVLYNTFVRDKMNTTFKRLTHFRDGNEINSKVWRIEDIMKRDLISKVDSTSSFDRN
jgi:hypothetical protein